MIPLPYSRQSPPLINHPDDAWPLRQAGLLPKQSAVRVAGTPAGGHIAAVMDSRLHGNDGYLCRKDARDHVTFLDSGLRRNDTITGWNDALVCRHDRKRRLNYTQVM